MISQSPFANEIKEEYIDEEFEVLDMTEKAEYLEDIDYLYQRSYSELVSEWKNGFRKSIYYKEMVLLLNQNIIEYRFMN